MMAAPALAQNTSDVNGTGTVEVERDLSQAVRRNISSFRTLDWRPYFSNLNNGAVLVDIDSRALHYWSADESVYKLYPSSVPLSEDLTRRGRTSVVRKVEGPDWRPTPSMKERNPEWPDYVPPGPDNPLGTHWIELSAKGYGIHGTYWHNNFGTHMSHGCINMRNEDAKWLFRWVTPTYEVPIHDRSGWDARGYGTQVIIE